MSRLANGMMQTVNLFTSKIIKTSKTSRMKMSQQVGSRKIINNRNKFNTRNKMIIKSLSMKIMRKYPKCKMKTKIRKMII